MQNPKYLQILQNIHRREGHGMATITNRQISLRTMKRLESLGLVKDSGLVLVCDGDGFAVQPERWRTGWTLTRAGHDLIGVARG